MSNVQLLCEYAIYNLLFRSDYKPFLSSLMQTGCNKTISWESTKEKSREVTEAITTLSLASAHLIGVTLSFCTF